MGSDDMPPRDPGIIEHAGEPVEQRFPAAERLAAERLGVALLDDVRGDGGGKREKAAWLHYTFIEQWNRRLVQIFRVAEAA